jgi:hypothetical protein
MPRRKNDNSSKCSYHTVYQNFSFYFFCFLFLIFSCARGTGKPTPEFRILDFFPPSGFQLPLTSVPLKISISFSKILDETTISDDTIKVYKDGTEIKKQIKIIDKQKVELTPDITGLGKYKVFVSKKIKSIIGQELQDDFSWEFTVVKGQISVIPPPTLPPLIKKIYPPHLSVVRQDTIIYAVFSKRIININSSNFFLQDINGKIIDSTINYIEGEEIAILKPKSPLEPSQTYIVTLREDITAFDGEKLGVNVVWLFSTFGIGPDVTPPEVIFISPPPNSAGIPLNTKIIILFSEDIDTSDITSRVNILEGGTTPINYTFNYDPNFYQLTISPLNLLKLNTQYTVKVRVKDKSGNEMIQDFISVFSTGTTTGGGGGGTTDNIPPQLLEIYIDNKKVNLPEQPTNVSLNPTIKFVFSEPINTSTVNSSSLFISDGINKINSNITFSTDLRTISLSPISSLQPGKTYWVYITGDIRDLAGNSLSNPVTFSFTTQSSPSIIITSPSPNSYIKGIMSVEVSFSGNFQKLELWINSLKRQTATPPFSSPFVFQEDTRLHADGQKTIRVIGYFSGGSTSYSVSVTFDNTPPVASIQSPPENGVITGSSAEITSVVNDSPDGILKRVELYVDGIFHSILTNPTILPNVFKFNLNTLSYSDGTHTIEIKAEDLAGNKASSGIRNIRIDNTPPTGNFISPSPGAVIGGLVALEVNASDNIEVKKVEFFVNSVRVCDAETLICEKTSPPYKIVWDSTSISSFPSASITASVEDLAGFKTVFGISVTIDNVPPSVGIITPSSGSYIRGSTPVQIANFDANGVTALSIFIDSVKLFDVSNPSNPYNFILNTSLYSDGTHSIRGVAYDRAGNSSFSEIFVVIDNTPPSGNISAPTSGFLTNSNGLTIQVSASDNILLNRVEFYIDNNLVGVDSSSPYSIAADISLLLEGTHSITAAIFDEAGNSFITPSPTTFIIDRTPPTAFFVEPSTDSVLQGTVTIRVSGVDLNRVSSISITAGSSSLGSCTVNAPSGTCIRNWATMGDANDVVITGVVLDSAGNQEVTQIVVMVDNIAPSASITSPTAFYLTCPTNTVIGVSTSDINTITAVVIRLVDITTSSDLANIVFNISPPSTTANVFATLTPAQCGSDGSKRIFATSYDKGGKANTQIRDFKVDNTPPGLNLIFPSASECVSNSPSGSTRVVFSACDNGFLERVSFYVDSTLINTISPGSSISCSTPQTYQITWNSSAFSDGPHTIQIIAIDRAGNTNTQTAPILVDNTPPTVTIISPPNNSSINSPIGVNVNLGDTGCAPPSYPFKKVEYQIKVSDVGSFISSTRDCSTSRRVPCVDTNVGSGTSTFPWDATEYCGFFILKAIGYDYAGNKAEATSTVKIQPPGCPIEKSWSPFNAVGSISTTPILRDLEGDGKKEIIFGTSTGRVYAVSQATAVQNSDAVGSPIKGVFLEILVSAVRKLVFGTGDPDRKIRVLNLTSPFLSSFSSQSTETAIFSPPSTIFTDGSTTVVLVGDLKGRVTAYEVGSSGFTFRQCYPAGTPLECGLNSAPISDINGDLQPDIVSSPLPVDTNCDGTYDTIIVTASDGYITAINLATRTKIWTIYTGTSLDSSPILADFGNDCNFEILVATKGGALYCVSETGGLCSGWTSQYFTVGAQIISPPAVTDVDSCLPAIGDTNQEIIFGNTGGNLYILSQSGSLKSSRNLGSFIVSTPAIADINGDGCGEIFVATGDGKIHGFYLVNRSGQLYPEYITGFPKATGGTISSNPISPIVCDIDSDSSLDLIIGNDSGSLRIYDLGTSGGTAKWIPGGRFCAPNAFGCQTRWETSICGW